MACPMPLIRRTKVQVSLPKMNNAAGNGNGMGEEVDEEEDADDAGIGVQGLAWLCADEGQPGAVDDASFPDFCNNHQFYVIYCVYSC